MASPVKHAKESPQNTADAEGPGRPRVKGIVQVLILALAATVAWLLIPVPESLDPKALHLFIIFVATIISLILQPFPLSVMALVGLTASVLTGCLTIEEGLSGFSNSVMWLIITAILISRAIIKSGLGNRIAVMFVSKLGKSAIGVAYALGLTDLVLAPATPSAMARGGAIVLPILKSISSAYGSEPRSATSGRIGKYLTLTAAHMNGATGALFLTAMAANPLIAGFAADFGLEISWTKWLSFAIVPGVLALVLTPLITYVVARPEVTDTREAVETSKAQLKEMGPLSRSEKIVIGVIVLLILLWTAGDAFLGINSTTTAIVGLVSLLLTNVLTLSDVTGERSAWDTLLWFAVLLTLASFLNKLGFIPWFSDQMASLVGGVNWVLAFVVLIVVYFYSHYFFASLTSHVAAMYSAFLGTAIAVGVPPMLAAMVLGFLSSYFATLTHFGGSAPTLLFAQGFFSVKEWWMKNFIMSLPTLLIWGGVAAGWMKVLGAW